MKILAIKNREIYILNRRDDYPSPKSFYKSDVFLDFMKKLSYEIEFNKSYNEIRGRFIYAKFIKCKK